jgi:hypothetical protein
MDILFLILKWYCLIVISLLEVITLIGIFQMAKEKDKEEFRKTLTAFLVYLPIWVLTILVLL